MSSCHCSFFPVSAPNFPRQISLYGKTLYTTKFQFKRLNKSYFCNVSECPGGYSRYVDFLDRALHTTSQHPTQTQVKHLTSTTESYIIHHTSYIILPVSLLIQTEVYHTIPYNGQEGKIKHHVNSSKEGRDKKDSRRNSNSRIK